MDLDQAIKKLIFRITVHLPGYEQLLPRAQANLKYEIKKILKQYGETLLDGHKEESCVTEPLNREKEIAE